MTPVSQESQRGRPRARTSSPPNAQAQPVNSTSQIPQRAPLKPVDDQRTKEERAKSQEQHKKAAAEVRAKHLDGIRAAATQAVYEADLNLRASMLGKQQEVEANLAEPPQPAAPQSHQSPNQMGPVFVVQYSSEEVRREPEDNPVEAAVDQVFRDASTSPTGT